MVPVRKRRTTRIAGKRCLITGAASGIGRATAEAASRAGAQLVLTDLNAEALDAVAAKLGEAVLFHRAVDIADYEAVRAMADEVHQQVGPLDVVMNVAGISTWGTVDKLEHRHWRRTVDVDLMGPIHVIECFVAEMVRAGRGGHLVNVSSAAGLFGLPWHAPYSAAKFGLRGLSEVLRYDLRRHRIGVTLVCPGAVKTGLVDTVDIVGADPERLARHRQHFSRRAVSSEAVAEKILDAIRHRRYLVFTSPDIRALYWTERFAPHVYQGIMMLMNRGLHAALRGRGAP